MDRNDDGWEELKARRAAEAGRSGGYASFVQRLGAYIADQGILFVVTYALTYFLDFGGVETVSGEELTRNDTMGMIIALSLSWGYYALQESSAHQATFGKRMMGIVVTDMDGRRLSFGRATLRYFGKLLSGLIFLLGYLMAAFTPRKQALHDYIAGTLVVRRPD